MTGDPTSNTGPWLMAKQQVSIGLSGLSPGEFRRLLVGLPDAARDALLAFVSPGTLARLRAELGPGAAGPTANPVPGADAGRDGIEVSPERLPVRAPGSDRKDAPRGRD